CTRTAGSSARWPSIVTRPERQRARTFDQGRGAHTTRSTAASVCPSSAGVTANGATASSMLALRVGQQDDFSYGFARLEGLMRQRGVAQRERHDGRRAQDALLCPDKQSPHGLREQRLPVQKVAQIEAHHAAVAVGEVERAEARGSQPTPEQPPP